ncbi:MULTISPECIES: hypothetical protein [Streptomyces]|uniref:hypothetical protein n=1 Tax=Streptomyces TaxID=1883 RepID=UPI00138993B5|nr:MULTISPECIES: hypothetical protein [Streptomyces]
MAGRLTRACTNLRVPPAHLLDALCALAGRPAPPRGPHPVRRVYGRVLQTVGSSPPGVLEPGDVCAATYVRAGLLNAEVPAPSDTAVLCIRRTVDDLGPADLWELARGTAMTRGDLSWGAAAVLAEGDSGAADLLDGLAAHTLAQEVAERSPCHWGRGHTEAVRAALYRSLADLADVLLEVSESTPTPLDWTVHDNGRRYAATAAGDVVTYDVLVRTAQNTPPAAAPVWHHPSLPAARTAWQWRIASGPADRASHSCAPFPSALAARHAAECAITALAAGRCGL